MKNSYEEFKNKDTQGPIYLKALLTLKFLLNEQAVDTSKFQKVRQLYSQITIENTLKLLIRCKILFASRYALLDLFESIINLDKASPDKVQFYAEKVLAKQHLIFNSQKFKNLKNKPFYFEGQDVIKRTGQKVVETSEEIEIRALDILVKEEIEYHENKLKALKEHPEIKELQDQIFNEESSLVQTTQSINKDSDIRAHEISIDEGSPQLPKTKIASSKQKLTLNINNLREDQINNLVKLDIITSDQADLALSKLNTIVPLPLKFEKKKRKRTKSVYNGPLRDTIKPVKRNYIPGAWGMSIQDRRNPISPKPIRSKFPAFGLPRANITAGGMGIGLDDYIFNNSKNSDVNNSPRKTKATEDNSLPSMKSRNPEEMKSAFVWSRGSRSSTRTLKLKGVHTDGQTSGNKTPIPHIGIQDGNLAEQPLDQEQDLDDAAIEISGHRVTNHTVRSSTEKMATLQDNKLDQKDDLAEITDIVRDSGCSTRTFDQRRNTVQNPNLVTIDTEQVFPLPPAAPVHKKVNIKKLQIDVRAQSVSNKDQERIKRILGDGRRVGYANPTLVPVLSRERNSELEGFNRARREASIDAYREKMKNQIPRHLVSMNLTETSVIQHNLSQVCSKSPDRSLNLDQPIEWKIQKLQQKLNDMGYPLPEGKRGLYLKSKINKIFSTTTYDFNDTNFDTGIDTSRKYVPPHGGHTKNSLIRQELQNYEHGGDLSDFQKEMLPLGGQINLHARISKKVPLFQEPQQYQHAVTNRTFSPHGSLYQGKSVEFTTQFSNTWLNPNDMMYRDTRMDLKSEDRHAKNVLANLERQVKKVERVKHREIKDQMMKFYHEKYGIQVSDQDYFFLDPERLREKFISKANRVQFDQAASRIQKWYKRILFHRGQAAQLIRVSKAIVVLQRFFRHCYALRINPKRKFFIKNRAAFYIQTVLRGYQARRKVMYLMLDHRADIMYEHFWRIDKIQRNHFQRLIRRAWLQYLWNKAEKKRKKAEKAKKNKGKKKKKKKKAAPKPDAVTDDADGVANITVGMGDEEDEEKDEEMGDMEGEMGEMDGEPEDKGEGEDEGASPSKDGDVSPNRSMIEGEHDEAMDLAEGDETKQNMLSIASENKVNFQPILDDDQLNIELNIDRSVEDIKDYQKLKMIVELAEKELQTPRDAEVQTRPVKIIEMNEASVEVFDMSEEVQLDQKDAREDRQVNENSEVEGSQKVMEEKQGEEEENQEKEQENEEEEKNQENEEEKENEEQREEEDEKQSSPEVDEKGDAPEVKENEESPEVEQKEESPEISQKEESPEISQKEESPEISQKEESPEISQKDETQEIIQNEEIQQVEEMNDQEIQHADNLEEQSELPPNQDLLEVENPQFQFEDSLKTPQNQDISEIREYQNKEEFDNNTPRLDAQIQVYENQELNNTNLVTPQNQDLSPINEEFQESPDHSEHQRSQDLLKTQITQNCENSAEINPERQNSYDHQHTQNFANPTQITSEVQDNLLQQQTQNFENPMQINSENKESKDSLIQQQTQNFDNPTEINPEHFDNLVHQQTEFNENLAQINSELQDNFVKQLTQNFENETDIKLEKQQTQEYDNPTDIEQNVQEDEDYSLEYQETMNKADSKEIYEAQTPEHIDSNEILKHQSTPQNTSDVRVVEIIENLQSNETIQIKKYQQNVQDGSTMKLSIPSLGVKSEDTD